MKTHSHSGELECEDSPGVPGASKGVGTMSVKATIGDVEEGCNGGCLNCGELQYGGIEPDARNYECESCGKMQVFGLEELVMMGRLELVDEMEE